MKIVLICPYFLPNVGGLELQVYNIGKGMIGKGHDVTILTSNSFGTKNNSLPSNDKIDGIKVKRFSLVPFSKLDKLLITPKIISELFSIDADVFHIFSFLPIFSTNISNMICRYRKKSLIITPTYHPYRSYMYNSISGKLTKLFYDNLIGTCILKMTDHIISLTESEANYYRMIGIKNVTTIPVGVYLENYGISKEQITNFKNKYDINGHIILFVGRIENRKGIPFLLESLPEVLKKFQNTKLVMAINQSDIPNNIKIIIDKFDIEKNVLFLGRLSQTELSCVYESADVVVIPSLFEAFSHIVIEAWTHKKPVIASRNIGLAEEISIDTGILADYGDTKALSESILKLLSDKNLCISLGLNGYAKVIEKFLWEKVIERLEKIYNSENSK